MEEPINLVREINGSYFNCKESTTIQIAESSGETRVNQRMVHLPCELPCGCMKMVCRQCIYGEILTKSTVFEFFGGAFAPSMSNAAPPLAERQVIRILSLSPDQTCIIQFLTSLYVSQEYYFGSPSCSLDRICGRCQY